MVVLVVGQPVIMRRNGFCSAGSITVCSCKFFWVTMEIPELSKAIISYSTPKMCSPERLSLESCGKGARESCRLWLVVLLSCSWLQMTIFGVACVWLQVPVVLWWEVPWRYSLVEYDSLLLWYLTFHKVDCFICRKPSILQDIPFSITALALLSLLSFCQRVEVKCNGLIILQEPSSNANTRRIHLKG